MPNRLATVPSDIAGPAVLMPNTAGPASSFFHTVFNYIFILTFTLDTD